MNVLSYSSKLQPNLWQAEVPQTSLSLHSDIPSLGKRSRAESWEGHE